VQTRLRTARGAYCRHLYPALDVETHVCPLRVVIDATGHLHQHIAAIRDRIRALQGALAEVHGEHSNDPHPLLATTAESSSEDDDVDEDPELAALTGAITDLEVADDGSTVFFGTAPSPLATPANTATLSAAVTRTAVSLLVLLSRLASSRGSDSSAT
jgi:hypothetical protein